MRFVLITVILFVISASPALADESAGEPAASQMHSQTIIQGQTSNQVVVNNMVKGETKSTETFTPTATPELTAIPTIAIVKPVHTVQTIVTPTDEPSPSIMDTATPAPTAIVTETPKTKTISIPNFFVGIVTFVQHLFGGL